jgi:hypothetical protein
LFQLSKISQFWLEALTQLEQRSNSVQEQTHSANRAR